MKNYLISNIILTQNNIIYPGVFLSSKEDLLIDQQKWSEFDESKYIDFTTCLYWITTDDGISPIDINNDVELLELFPEIN